jgi:uncharacterized protein (DUF58 family)
VTSLGFRTLATSATVAAAGALLGWPALAALGSAVAAACLLSLLVLVRRPDLVIERRIVPTTVSRGDPVIAHLTVRNRAPYRFRGGAAFSNVGPDVASVRLPPLAPFDRTLVATRLPSDRRGRHEVSPVLQRRFDPFGFVTAEQPHGRPEELIVMPRDLGFARLSTALMRDIDGSTDDSDPRGTMVFHQLREYVPGDDVRRIHWKATARQAHTGTLIVRQDVDVARPSTTVLVDLRGSRYSEETFELGLDAAASAVHAARRSGSPVTLLFTDGRRIESRAETDRTPLTALALVGPHADGSLQQQFEGLRRGRGGATLIVITGVPRPPESEDADAVAAARLRGLYRRIIFITVTPDVRPARRFAGIIAIQARTAEDLVRAWSVAASR